jgi:hypothetical protein
MLFRKLFQVLVVGGAAVGLTSGCTTPAQAQESRDAKTKTAAKQDAPDAGVVKADNADAGNNSGGGVSGW